MPKKTVQTAADSAEEKEVKKPRSSSKKSKGSAKKPVRIETQIENLYNKRDSGGKWHAKFAGALGVGDAVDSSLIHDVIQNHQEDDLLGMPEFWHLFCLYAEAKNGTPELLQEIFERWVNHSRDDEDLHLEYKRIKQNPAYARLSVAELEDNKENASSATFGAVPLKRASPGPSEYDKVSENGPASSSSKRLMVRSPLIKVTRTKDKIFVAGSPPPEEEKAMVVEPKSMMTTTPPEVAPFFAGSDDAIRDKTASQAMEIMDGGTSAGSCMKYALVKASKEQKEKYGVEKVLTPVRVSSRIASRKKSSRTRTNERNLILS
jgi:hypothetical protein